MPNASTALRTRSYALAKNLSVLYLALIFGLLSGLGGVMTNSYFSTLWVALTLEAAARTVDELAKLMPTQEDPGMGIPLGGAQLIRLLHLGQLFPTIRILALVLGSSPGAPVQLVAPASDSTCPATCNSTLFYTAILVTVIGLVLVLTRAMSLVLEMALLGMACFNVAAGGNAANRVACNDCFAFCVCLFCIGGVFLASFIGRSTDSILVVVFTMKQFAAVVNLFVVGLMVSGSYVAFLAETSFWLSMGMFAVEYLAEFALTSEPPAQNATTEEREEYAKSIRPAAAIRAVFGGGILVGLWVLYAKGPAAYVDLQALDKGGCQSGSLCFERLQQLVVLLCCFSTASVTLAVLLLVWPFLAVPLSAGLLLLSCGCAQLANVSNCCGSDCCRRTQQQRPQQQRQPQPHRHRQRQQDQDHEQEQQPRVVEMLQMSSSRRAGVPANQGVNADLAPSPRPSNSGSIHSDVEAGASSV